MDKKTIQMIEAEYPVIHREEITGLLEGQQFFRPAQRMLEQLDESWCIVYVDIEHYKLFVDWYGLAAGQDLLKDIAEILRREADAVGGLPGYLGQDQFCLIAPCDWTRIEALFEQLREAVVSLSRIEGFLPILGVAVFDGNSTHVRGYLNDAALAADEGKGDAHTRIHLYDARIHREHAEEYQLLYEFREALDRGEISFWLQPQYFVRDNRIIGAEALTRWVRPDGTMIPPGQLLPVLEKYDLVSRLDVFIWESVCRWLRDWMDRGKTPVPVSVNVSRVDLLAMDVPEYFAGLLKRYDLEPGLIKVEITESICAEDSSAVRTSISSLRKMGITVLMDDFGSGYSSLNMLRSVEMDVIKLDARFLQIEGRDKEEEKGISILESVVNMTRNLATPIIVEGVETLEQVRVLLDMGCRYMQGFYFRRPMPVEEFEALIGDGKSIDTRGITFKSNQQLQVREFLNENIYSDVMLNNILGPVAFFYWHGEDVDVVRYNEQYFRMVGLPADVLNQRIGGLQRFLHPGDDEKLYRMLQYAKDHHAVGSRGVVRAYRPNGVMVWVSLQLYCIDEDEQGAKFYASAEDVTEAQFFKSELPGSYFRCTRDHEFTFLFISRNFIRLTGFSETEIEQIFDNKLINMIHPNDRARVIDDSDDILERVGEQMQPYRIQKKTGEYIYIADQCQLTDAYGAPCWQSMVLNVDDVMRSRNNMRILSDYLSDSILLLRRIGNDLVFEVPVHGLGRHLGVDIDAFGKALNDRSFYSWVEGFEPTPDEDRTEALVRSFIDRPRILRIHIPDGRLIRVMVRADHVDEKGTDIAYIVHAHLIEEKESDCF